MSQTLHDLLSRIAGFLAPHAEPVQPNLQVLHQSLSRALLSDDLEQMKASSFAFEGAEFLSPQAADPQVDRALRAVAEAGPATPAEPPAFRAFLREVSVRSTQLPGSVASWANGSAVDHSVGPFLSKDGRQFWFDFFAIERLVSLYLPNDPSPAILFSMPISVFAVSGTPGPATSYKIVAGSVWIRSNILAKETLPNLFTGLQVAGGTVRLSAAPSIVDDHLTAAAGSMVTVQLDLQQPTSASDPTSPYGADARAAVLQLPTQLLLRFGPQLPVAIEASGAHWELFGSRADFSGDFSKPPVYNALFQSVLIPYVCSEKRFDVRQSLSPYLDFQGGAAILNAAWALPTAAIDVLHPTAAEGIGSAMVGCGPGISVSWPGLKSARMNLGLPVISFAPGHITVGDAFAGNAFCTQEFRLWQDGSNKFGTHLKVQYPAVGLLSLLIVASGDEAYTAVAACDLAIDRPVSVEGVPFPVRSGASALSVIAKKTSRTLFAFDESLLQKLATPPPVALALRNALLKVTPVSGYVLFGTLSEDFGEVTTADLFLSFGLYAYVPALPDPYAANLGGLQFQFRGTRASFGSGAPWLLLICEVRWKPKQSGDDHVIVSFHFAPLPSEQVVPANNKALSVRVGSVANASEPILAPWEQAFSHTSETELSISGLNEAGSQPQTISTPGNIVATLRIADVIEQVSPRYDTLWNDLVDRLLAPEIFALLDVSTRADLLGVSFGAQRDRPILTRTADQRSSFPLQVKGMSVVSQATNVRVFTVPQISWEPVVNLTQPTAGLHDPPFGPNYYPNDGGPTRIINNSMHEIALAPIPLTDFLVEKYNHDETFAAKALFTLPYGLKSIALLKKQYKLDATTRRGSAIAFDPTNFKDGLRSARHLELNGGEVIVGGESDSFMGCTLQLDNILDLNGSPTATGTLGQLVADIFNGEFLLDPFDIEKQRGVPVTRIDLSGYGASTFSNWLSPDASFAETSQARFDVFLGRCAHEVIQVKSVLYPNAAPMVRTITLFRTSSGYTYRWDSGWVAQGPGKFDFSYFAPESIGGLPQRQESGYEIHPGAVRAVWNIQNIKDATDVLPFTGTMTIRPGGRYVDENGIEQTNGGSDRLFTYELRPVYFDADVEVENPVTGFKVSTLEGQARKVCASKHILGFVQIAPRGMPISREAFRDLLARQGGIGGPLDCILDLNASGQQMRIRSFDVSPSVAADGTTPVFVAAPRGSTLLPKDGSWSMVQHTARDGTVIPVPATTSIPVVRIGALTRQPDKSLAVVPAPASQLLRIAEPSELLRPPGNTTVNYGFLHSTDTQKALFLTPAYAAGKSTLLSKTPPLFADAFRIVNSKTIFPNIGDAVTGFGDVINLGVHGTEFKTTALTDAGAAVREIMQINQVDGAGSIQQGYKLLKQAANFALPSTAWNLIDLGSAFKIYIEYKAGQTGSLNYDVDSFASNVEDTWKSHMQDVSLVVDLGPISRLITIRGGWDARKGSQATYGGTGDTPTPQLIFAPELNPIIAILQILEELQTGNYAAAFSDGVHLAMSNKAAAWEYKFEASKEIPVLKFPTPLEDSPIVPLKLEAGLKLSAYFNAALKVTTDAKQLLPSAGGSIGFYGKLSVMCVSLAAASVYAVGQVNLDIGADTANGPSLKMQFGFGAQIVIGLPIAGNVSVLYMVGTEMFLDSKTLEVSAFLLYQGQAELVGGLICITITIEAKGSITRDNAAGRTDLTVEVSFAIDISLFLVIDIDYSTSWQEQRQIA
jgi:hypothetical protein